MGNLCFVKCAVIHCSLLGVQIINFHIQHGMYKLISGVFEHSVLHLWEMYALLNVLLYIAVYGPYKS